MMADYFRPEQLAARCGLPEEELQGFEDQGVIRAIEKNGYRYYSVREFYRLKAILRLMRDEGLRLADARIRVDGGKPPATARTAERKAGQALAR